MLRDERVRSFRRDDPSPLGAGPLDPDARREDDPAAVIALGEPHDVARSGAREGGGEIAARGHVERRGEGEREGGGEERGHRDST